MDQTKTRQESRIEGVTVLLLAVAALVTSWAAYQSSLWSGVSVDNYANASTLEVEASTLRDTALNSSQEDQSAFLEYAKAVRSNDLRLAALVKNELMSKRLRDAFDTWEKAPPASREPSPLSDKYGYQIPARGASLAKLSASRAAMDVARDASSTGDFYNLAAVLLAASLFLLGISSTFRIERFRAGMVVIATLILLAATIWMVTLSVRNPF